MPVCWYLYVVMSINLAYSAPIENSTILLNSTTTSTAGGTLDKPLLRVLSEADNTPGKCCAFPHKGPYDFDDKCGISDNRTLCGYNKNQKKPKIIETSTIIYGLICQSIDDRLVCGHGKVSGVAPVARSTVQPLISTITIARKTITEAPQPTLSTTIASNTVSKSTPLASSADIETLVHSATMKPKPRIRQTTIECVEIHSKWLGVKELLGQAGVELDYFFSKINRGC